MRQETGHTDVNKQAALDGLGDFGSDDRLFLEVLLNIGPDLFLISLQLGEDCCTLFILFLDDGHFHRFANVRDFADSYIGTHSQAIERDIIVSLSASIDHDPVTLKLDDGDVNNVPAPQQTWFVSGLGRQVCNKSRLEFGRIGLVTCNLGLFGFGFGLLWCGRFFWSLFLCHVNSWNNRLFDCCKQVLHFKESIRFTCGFCSNVFVHVHHVDPSQLRMNENQFLSIKPKRMLVKPFKPASLPADVGFTSRNGRAGKLDCSARIALDFQQRIVLLDTLRSRQCPAPHAGVRLYCLVFSLRGPGHT